MTNSWTGGQYSIFRALFGVHIFVQIVHLFRAGTEIFSSAGMRAETAVGPLLHWFPSLLFVWDSPAAVRSLLGVGAIASLALAIGVRDRIAALVLLYVGACLITRNPLIANPGSIFVGALLLAHCLLPARPFGAWDARGRIDPDGGWRMPASIHTAAWIVMAAGYAFAGVSKSMTPEWIDGNALQLALDDPLALSPLLRDLLRTLPAPLLALATWAGMVAQLLFAPLALIRRFRPWLWLGFFVMQLGTALVIDVSQQSAGLMLLHLFTFDPGWIAPRRPERHTQGPTLVFYDGGCGLCHRTIRFLLAEDADGSRFRFAPLDSDAFRAALRGPGSGFAPDAPIPDSVLVQPPGERMSSRAEGVLELGHQLGGLWRLMAIVVGWIPLPALNAAYDLVARTRQRLFAKPADACPLLPPRLQDRFAR